MHTDFTIAVFAGLGGMLGWGFSEFATKKSVDRIGTISSLVWAHVIGTLILVAILCIRVLLPNAAVSFPVSISEWLGLIFFGTLQTAVYYFAYSGFEKGHVSVLSPVFASFAGLVALLSFLIFGEVLHVTFLPAFALILGGVIGINLDGEGLQLRRLHLRGVPGLREILIATLLATIWTLGWDRFIENKDWMVFTTFMFAFMTLSAYFIARFKQIDLFKTKSGIWKFLWLIALGEVVAYLAIALGYASTSYTSIVAILSGASALPTIILARLFLKEKMTTIQVTASAIILVGVLLLSVD
jgi:drug/metabolite transporter (DMT)-like permease